MRFIETTLTGAYIIELDKMLDHRGWFADNHCHTVFSDRDLESQFIRSAIAFNHSRFTLRGLHGQASPHGEVKLIRCIRGAIYDVILDLRKDSNTYCKWQGFELSADNRSMLYVPEGFVHGYLTLTVDAEIFYQMSEDYNPRAEIGIRYDDSYFSIEWPTYPSQISNKDMSWPDFKGEVVV